MTVAIEAKEVTVDLDIDIKCSECGESLKAEYVEHTSSYYRVTRELCVDPCPKCLEKAKEKGKEDGKLEAELEN